MLILFMLSILVSCLIDTLFLLRYGLLYNISVLCLRCLCINYCLFLFILLQCVVIISWIVH